MSITLQQHITAILAAIFPGEAHYIIRKDICGAVVSSYAVFSIVGGETYQDLESDLDTERPRIQISIYAAESSDLIAKKAAVKEAMKTAAILAQTSDPGTDEKALFNYSSSVPVDGYEEETRRYYSHMDFYCWQ